MITGFIKDLISALDILKDWISDNWQFILAVLALFSGGYVKKHKIKNLFQKVLKKSSR